MHSTVLASTYPGTGRAKSETRPILPRTCTVPRSHNGRYYGSSEYMYPNRRVILVRIRTQRSVRRGGGSEYGSWYLEFSRRSCVRTVQLQPAAGAGRAAGAVPVYLPLFCNLPVYTYLHAKGVTLITVTSLEGLAWHLPERYRTNRRVAKERYRYRVP